MNYVTNNYKLNIGDYMMIGGGKDYTIRIKF